MLSKKHSPLYWMCLAGCLSYAGILFFALSTITILRVSTPISEEIVKNGGYYVLH